MTTASIVVHNSPVWQLNTVLTCLENSSVDKVFLIDNSPTEYLKKVAGDFSKVEYYHVPNQGYGAGHNVGIKKSIDSGAEFHLVLNADVKWERDIILNLKEYMAKNPKVGILSPKTYYPDGSLQYTCRRLPSPYDLFLRIFIPERLCKQRMNSYLLKDHNPDKELNCPYLLGSFLFFRVDALKDCGLFDERFFMYPEDIDITRRLYEKWQTLYWPGVSIIHEHQQASKKNLRMFWIHFSNMVKYFNKWGWFSDNKRKEINKKLSAEIKNYL